MAGKWCPGAESNHRHCDFQSHALPTELPGQVLQGRKSPTSRRVIVGWDGAVYRCEAQVSTFLRRRSRPKGGAAAAHGRTRQISGITGLFDVILIALGSWDDVGAAQPAMEIDVAAAGRAERTHGLGRGPVADRAAADGLGGRSGGRVGRLVGHWQLFRRWRGRINPRCDQTATVFSQPKRIGNPSPASRLVVSYSGRPTTFVYEPTIFTTNEPAMPWMA